MTSTNVNASNNRGESPISSRICAQTLVTVIYGKLEEHIMNSSQQGEFTEINSWKFN